MTDKKVNIVIDVSDKDHHILHDIVFNENGILKSSHGVIFTHQELADGVSSCKYQIGSE
jgi:hypothetical protein